MFTQPIPACCQNLFLVYLFILIKQNIYCPSGTSLQGRRDWTDQQPVGTVFAGFTCCPVGYLSEYDAVIVVTSFHSLINYS